MSYEKELFQDWIIPPDDRPLLVGETVRILKPSGTYVLGNVVDWNGRTLWIRVTFDDSRQYTVGDLYDVSFADSYFTYGNRVEVWR